MSRARSGERFRTAGPLPRPPALVLPASNQLHFYGPTSHDLSPHPRASRDGAPPRVDTSKLVSIKHRWEHRAILGPYGPLDRRKQVNCWWELQQIACSLLFGLRAYRSKFRQISGVSRGFCSWAAHKRKGRPGQICKRCR